MTFGKKLSTLRKQANLTQQDLADKLHVSRQAITKWEKGVGLPDLDNIKMIANYFNVTIDYLLDMFLYAHHLHHPHYEPHSLA